MGRLAPADQVPGSSPRPLLPRHRGHRRLSAAVARGAGRSLMTNDGVVTLVNEVSTRALPLSRLEPVIGRERYGRLISIGSSLRNRLGERTVWNVNSTAVGGGVA